MKTCFFVLVKAEIDVGCVIRCSGGQLDRWTVGQVDSWTGGRFYFYVAQVWRSGQIGTVTGGNTTAVRCCDAVTMLLAAQGVVVKVKVKFTLEQVTKAQRWSRGIALLFL